LSHTTRTVAFGFTERMPSANALMPCTTSGTGKPATYPATPRLLFMAASRPASQRAS
jgi:hypothetical protein